MKFKAKIDKNVLKYTICMIPFFKLQTFDMFVSQNYQVKLWSLIENIFNLGMVLLTAYFVYKFINKGRKPHNISTIGIAIYFFACIVICICNGSFYFGLVYNGITCIGLAVLLEEILYKSSILLEKCCGWLFGIYSIIGATLNIVMPYGFLSTSNKAIAIYFLGSKNSSYFYFAIFMYFLTLRYLKKEKGILELAIPIFLLAGLYFCDSKGGLVCVGISALYFFIIHFWNKIYKLICPQLLLAILGMIFYFVVFSPNIPLLSNGLHLIGKDLEYGGRTVLWQSAIKMYTQHPLLGNGAQLILMNKTAQTQAHNFYLDQLARFGTLPLLVILTNIICIVSLSIKRDNKKVVALKSVFIFSFLLHCIFDTTSIRFLVLIMTVIECSGSNINKKFSILKKKDLQI